MVNKLLSIIVLMFAMANIQAQVFFHRTDES